MSATARRPVRSRLAASLVAGLAACAPPPAAPHPWSAEELAAILSLSPIPELPEDPTNRVADVEAAAVLGQRLFFDVALSRDGSVSCATCHKPSLYFTDGQPRAVGLEHVPMHTPSVIGSQWSPFLFWDGRKDSLWSQALAPIESPAEMGGSRVDVARLLHTRWRAEYESLFGTLPNLADEGRFPRGARPVPEDPTDPAHRAWSSLSDADRDAVTEVYVNAGKCIAAYERRLAPRPAPFDRYAAALRDGDPTGGGHLTEGAVTGLRQFIGEAGCIRCHSGPLFTDHAFHNIGLPLSPLDEGPPPGRTDGARQVLADPFRSDGAHSDTDENPEITFLDPSFEDFVGAFRTPTLRNIAETAPYGHAGQLADLDEVIEFYRELPRVPLAGHRDLMLEPLSDEASSHLVEFLATLTGPLPDERWLTVQ